VKNRIITFWKTKVSEGAFKKKKSELALAVDSDARKLKLFEYFKGTFEHAATQGY
jgi:hypothetical protein